MEHLSRRQVIGTGALAVGAVAGGFPGIAFAQTQEAEPGLDPQAVQVTRILSDFVAKSDYSQLSADAVVAAKRGILDTIGVTLGGAPEEVSRVVQRYARSASNRGDATVLGGGFKANANLAAYVNGTMSHALDYDNVIHVDNVWMGHPSVAVLPAALAIAERYNLSGKELLLAYCLGVEVYTKVGLLCGNDPYLNGWHNTSYIGSVATAAAVARLRRLSPQLTARSLGVAGSAAGGIRQNFGTMTKPLHAGLAARAGVEAVELTEAGLTASEHIFEGVVGFRSAFLGRRGGIKDRVPLGDGSVTAAQFAALLGAPWNIAAPGMAYKICPSCRASHYGLEAGLEFTRARPFAVAQIAEVECHMPAETGEVLFYHDPKTGLQGKFSLEYVLARTLLDGVPKTTDFTTERVNEPLAKALVQKLKWMPFEHPKSDPGFPTFIFKAVDGKQWRTKIEHLTGEPERPVSDAVLAAKFDDMAAPVLTAADRSRARDMILGLERLGSVAPLMSALAGAPSFARA